MKFNIRFPLFSPEGDAGAGGSGGGGASSTLLSGGGGQSQAAPATQEPPNGTEGAKSSYDIRSSLDENGGFKPGWHDALPEDLKEYAAEFGKYPNAIELLRGHANKAKMIGQRTQLKPPGADAKPDEIAAWRKLNGVPENADGYGLKKPEKLPEGVQWDEKTSGEFAKLAHEIGLTPVQAQKLLDFDIKTKEGMFTSGKARIDAYLTEQRTDLQTAWGDKYEANVSQALKAAQMLGLDPNDAEIGNSAKMIKALHAASLLMQEDKLVGAGNGALAGEALAEDIRRNPLNPWHNAYHGKEGKERQAEAAAMISRARGIPDSAKKSM